MKSEISLKNKKALNIPEKGFIHRTAVVLSSDCEKSSDDTVSYEFLFKRNTSRDDLLSVINRYSKDSRINLDDGDMFETYENNFALKAGPLKFW